LTQLLNPNLHVILIHVPIAMLFVGTFIETFAFLWRRSSFRTAGRWMILVGALATIPATTTGMFAARQAMRQGPDTTWADLKQTAQLNAAQWDHLNHHVKFNAIAATLLGVLIVTWLGASDSLRQKGHFIYLAALLAAVGLIGAGSWHGGELVYKETTGPGLVTTGLRPFEAAPETSSTEPADKSKVVFDSLNYAGKQITRFDDLIDVHALLAGWVVAFAVVTLGLSFRNLSLVPVEVSDTLANDEDIIHALAGRAGDSRTMSAPLPTRIETPILAPASRFWLLVALLAIGAILTGWMIASPSAWEDVVYYFKDGTKLRDRAHIIAGGSILVLSLLLALSTRFAPHNRVLVGCFSLLLVTALAAQVWLGVLLLFDTSEGALNHFNAPTTQVAT